MNLRSNKIIIADVISMVIFSLITGALVEIFISNLSIMQMLKSRLTAIPVNIIYARPYGFYRDYILNRFNVKNDEKIRYMIFDTLIFTSFKVPIYALILYFAKADPMQILKSCLAVSLCSSFFGRTYGIFMDYTRSFVYRFANNSNRSY